MRSRILPFLLAMLVLLGLPLGFFFYYKKKIDALPKEADKVQVYWEAPDFNLATHTGDSLSRSGLMGNIYVVDFIFTNCTGVCPNLSRHMARLQETFREEPDVKLVSISIDPQRDSIPVLMEYASRYGATPGKWYFLSGDSTTVWKLASDGFKVPVVYTPEGGAGNEFTHTDKMILVDSEGKIRGFYSGMDHTSVDSLNNNIARLLLGKLKS